MTAPIDTARPQKSSAPPSVHDVVFLLNEADRRMSDEAALEVAHRIAARRRGPIGSASVRRCRATSDESEVERGETLDVAGHHLLPVSTLRSCVSGSALARMPCCSRHSESRALHTCLLKKP